MRAFLHLVIIALATMAILNFVFTVTKKQEKPLTNWEKVYNWLKEDKSPILYLRGVSSEDEKPVAVYLVDDNRWYHVSTFTIRGCGEKEDETNHLLSLRSVKLYRVPAADAKIVLLGAGRPSVKEILFEYPEEDE